MKYFITYGIICFSFFTFSQQVLTFEGVIQRTLEKNFDVIIARNNTKIAENNNNPGAAGYIPKVGIQADQSFSSSNIKQQFLSGQSNEKNGATNDALIATARLDWTFFDGFAMFARDKRLQLTEDVSRVQQTAQMEMSIYQAAVLFYNLQYSKRLQTVYEEAIQLSKERYELILLKSKNGAASEMELIQAKLDLTSDSSAYLTHLNSIQKMKRDLAIVMGENAELQFDVDQTDMPKTNLQFETVKANALEQNTDLMLQKSQIAIIDQQRKELQSRYYPQLGIYAQYSVNLSHSQAGFLLSNRSLGPGVGITLNWSILDGLSKVTSVKNNKLEKENATLRIQKQEQTILSEVTKAWNDYEYAKRMYQLESESILNTSEMFDIAQKSFENGALTQFELREIQFSIIQAKNRQLMSELNVQTAILNIALFTGNYKNMIP